MNREPHPKDTCYCGDYREQHKEGKGACSLNGLGHPLGDCTRFRLSRYHDGTRPPDEEVYERNERVRNVRLKDTD